MTIEETVSEKLQGGYFHPSSSTTLFTLYQHPVFVTEKPKKINFFPDSLSDKGSNVLAFRATSSVELEAVAVLRLVVVV
jgi:hypothetical protein